MYARSKLVISIVLTLIIALAIILIALYPGMQYGIELHSVKIFALSPSPIFLFSFLASRTYDLI